jgi:hypothetical protein
MRLNLQGPPDRFHTLLTRNEEFLDKVQPTIDLVCDRGVNDEAVWRKHSEEPVRYSSILVGSSDAEDLLSAVVVRVLAAKGSLSALADARPYLFRAVLNESKNHRRQFRTPPQIREAVLLTIDDGAPILQRPVAGYAFFPEPVETGLRYTVEAYDASGTVIGLWESVS